MLYPAGSSGSWGPACTAALVLFASAVMHGYQATAFVDKPPDKSIALRWETILRVSVSLLLDAIVRLPVSVWIFRVAFTLWVNCTGRVEWRCSHSRPNLNETTGPASYPE
jgi:hypothetical protein